MKIIQDTREKTPWGFHFYDSKVTVAKLDYGDYTTEKLKDVIRIERKASVSEIANNLGFKKNRERFYRELAKLSNLDFAYIICEFPESQVYQYPNLPEIPEKVKASTRMNGKFLRRLLHEIESKFGVIVVFCDSRDEAEKTTFDLLKAMEDG